MSGPETRLSGIGNIGGDTAQSTGNTTHFTSNNAYPALKCSNHVYFDMCITKTRLSGISNIG